MEALYFYTMNMCKTCGTEFLDKNPPLCPICNDDRQYIPQNGQQWTTYECLAATHQIAISAIEPNLYALQVSPAFAIDQRALLVLSPKGNILWDCIPLITE